MSSGRALLICIALPVLAAAPLAAAAEVNPHAFMADPAQCQRCHETTPERGKDDFTSVTFKKDIVTLCVECHQNQVEAEMHPVDIKPERPVPPRFHLDNYFSITCATCHDPHGAATGYTPAVPSTWIETLVRRAREETTFRTYFLRQGNADGGLCLSCHTREALSSLEERTGLTGAEAYVGSEKCRQCHPAIYGQWKLTVHARYVGDARANPKAVRAVFDGDKPFPPKDLLYTLGEHWTQRYVVVGKKENDPQVRPEIWSLQAGKWIDSGSYSRSWHRFCAGCHVTAFNPYTGKFLETGIGCEACHGPGKAHSETTDQYAIVNPARLNEQRRDMICESCHTSGHDRSGQFRFPVGYRPGDDLTKYLKGLIPKPGQETDTYKGDGTYEDRHRQFHYWMERYNITTGILCDVCKNFRQRPEGASDDIFLSSSEFCATCHPWYWKNYKEHSRHTNEQAECIECHTPLLSRDRKQYTIHDHKFQFGPPVRDEDLTLEQRCRRCHGKKDNLAMFKPRVMP